MKKFFSNKQFAITAIAIIALCAIIAISTSFETSSVAYASSADMTDEIYYTGLDLPRQETETFSYATKTTESYYINPTFPAYYNLNNTITNTCAPVAGTIILGYYDRYFTDLIPNVTVGRSRNGVYTYYAMTVGATGKQAVIDDLYQRMQTNVSGAGSTQTQYESGLTSYVQSIGYTISYESVLTNGSFDLNKAVAQLKNGKPISLSMVNFCFASVTDSGNSVTLNKNVYDNNHIAVAYGYEKVNYYNANGALIRSEIYLSVSSGLSAETGVYLVNGYGTLNHAKAINIQ